MIRAGNLRHIIRIERATTISGDAGKPIKTWAVLGTTRAEITRNEAEVTPKDKGTINTRTVAFKMRFRDDVRLQDRIVHGGFAYLVEAVTELGRRAGLEIRTTLDGAV